MLSVAELKPGESGIVVEVTAGPGKAHQLAAIGVRPGARVTKCTGQPFHGPVTLRVGQTEIAVGFGVARRIMVEMAR